MHIYLHKYVLRIYKIFSYNKIRKTYNHNKEHIDSDRFIIKDLNLNIWSVFIIKKI